MGRVGHRANHRCGPHDVLRLGLARTEQQHHVYRALAGRNQVEPHVRVGAHLDLVNRDAVGFSQFPAEFHEQVGIGRALGGDQPARDAVPGRARPCRGSVPPPSGQQHRGLGFLIVGKTDLDDIVEAGLAQQRRPPVCRDERRGGTQVDVRECPERVEESEGQRQKRRVVCLVDEQLPAVGQQFAEPLQRTTQLRGGVQRVGGDDQIELTGREALLAEVLV